MSTYGSLERRGKTKLHKWIKNGKKSEEHSSIQRWYTTTLHIVTQLTHTMLAGCGQSLWKRAGEPVTGLWGSSNFWLRFRKWIPSWCQNIVLTKKNRLFKCFARNWHLTWSTIPILWTNNNKIRKQEVKRWRIDTNWSASQPIALSCNPENSWLARWDTSSCGALVEKRVFRNSAFAVEVSLDAMVASWNTFAVTIWSKMYELNLVFWKTDVLGCTKHTTIAKVDNKPNNQPGWLIALLFSFLLTPKQSQKDKNSFSSRTFVRPLVF